MNTIEDNKTPAFDKADIRLYQLSTKHCPPCKQMKKAISNEFGDQDIGYQWIDLEANLTPELMGLVQQLAVRSVPTFAIVDTRNKTIHGKWSGGGSMDSVRDYVQKYKS